MFNTSKIKLNTTNFKEAMKSITNVIDKNNVYPIYQNVLIKSDVANKKINFTASNNSMQISTKIDFNQTSEIDTTFPAKKVFDWSKLIDSEEIDIIQDEKNITFKSNKSTVVSAIIDSLDYPQFEFKDEIISFEINAEKLCTIFNKISSSSGKDDIRTYLNGVLLDFTKNSICFVCSNGKVLSKYKHYANFENEFNLIIPIESVFQINKLLEKSKENLKITCSKHAVKIETQCIVFFTKLIDAVFPNYKKIIPDVTENIMTVKRKDLLNSLNRMNIFSDKNNIISLNINKNVLYVSCAGNTESCTDELQVESNIESGLYLYNINYLKNMVYDLFKGDDIVFSLPESCTNTLFFCKDEENQLGLISAIRP